MLRWADGVVAGLGRGVVRPLTLLGVVLLSLTALLAVQERFRERTGRPVLDTQDTVTVDAAVAQIRAYDDAARAWYAGFAVVDVVFPVAAAVLLAVVARRAALAGPRRTSGASLVPPRIALLCLLPAVADLAENVGLVTAVFAGGPPGVVAAALVAKSAKLTSIAASGVLVLALVGLALATAAVRWWMRRRRKAL